jgi:hypothetical protein
MLLSWPSWYLDRLLDLGPVDVVIASLMVTGTILAGTIAFDTIHFVLHRFMRSSSKLLQAVGSLHAAHHRFYDEQLVVHPAYTVRNMVMHIVPETATQLVVVSLFGLFVDWFIVNTAQIVCLINVTVVLLQKGRDFNHQPHPFMASPRRSLHVSPTYHALHHVHPDHYFSSIVTVFDRVMGTALPVKGRRFLITGASGAFGAPLAATLEARGAVVTRARFGSDWTYDDISGLKGAMAEADVLVLAHGSKRDHAQQANCDSFVALIEQFLAAHQGKQVPPEVWAVGSEIEAHPHFGVEELKIYSASKRNYARYAHAYYFDERVLYRHIVPSAFTSPMGKGLISGTTAVRIALFLLDRGFRYVPVTYTGVALLNWFKFQFSRSLVSRRAVDAATA